MKWRVQRDKEKPKDSNEEHLEGKEQVQSRKIKIRSQVGRSEIDLFGEVAVTEEVILCYI